MQNSHKFGILAILLLLLTVMAVGVYATDGGNPDFAADVAPASSSVNDVIGDDPDENGYSGPIVAAEAFDALQLDENDPDLGSFDWSEQSLEGQPDSRGAEGGGSWSHFHYFYAAGSTFHATESAMGSDYQAGACLSAVSLTNEFFALRLNLPEGSRIDYLRLYYYDTHASDGLANISKYDSIGTTDVIGSVDSSGTAGYGTTLSPLLEEIVTNVDGGYVLNWLPSATGNDMRLCGMRVAYRLPVN